MGGHLWERSCGALGSALRAGWAEGREGRGWACHLLAPAHGVGAGSGPLGAADESKGLRGSRRSRGGEGSAERVWLGVRFGAR